MSTHTRGPWRYEYDDEDDDGIVCVDDNLPGRAVVAEIAGQREMQANGHLIAAAPDLLRELKHLASLLRPALATANVPGLATLNGADAAIAKAEGKGQAA